MHKPYNFLFHFHFWCGILFQPCSDSMGVDFIMIKKIHYYFRAIFLLFGLKTISGNDMIVRLNSW